MTKYHFFYLIMFVCLFASCETSDDNNEKTGNIVKDEDNTEETNHSFKVEIFEGYVQKGPFVSGSSVTIQELDAELNQTGKNFYTTIINNMGNFERKNFELVSQYAQLKADGYYFNEITGKTSVGQISLNALVDVSESNTANINVLTHLERARVEYLVQEMNMPFTEAKKQALKEVLGIFSLNLPTATVSESLNLTDDAILLAVSCILQGSLSTGDVVELMAKIILDIRTSGKLNDQALGSRLFNNAVSLPLPVIRKNMEDKYAELSKTVTVPNFEQYILQFLANTSYEQSDFITYPARGEWGINVLYDATNSVSIYNPFDVDAQSYSLAANVPVGQKLKVVISSLDWGYQAIPSVNWEGVYTDNNHTIELSTIEGGKLSDLRIAPYNGAYNPVDKKYYTTLEIYENDAKTPRIKVFEFLTYKMPQEIEIDSFKNVQYIPITDYVLNSDCQWTNLAYDNKEIIPINSKSEMEKFCSCSEGTFADIDFSNNTLLIASGATKIYGFGKISKRFVKVEDKYVFDVGIFYNNTLPATKWVIAVVIDKFVNQDIWLHVVVN